MLIPLKKVDSVQRLVFGSIGETPDRSGEIFDYDTSAVHFKAWSDELAKSSDGKNLGNVRAMHNKVAAGKLVAIEFDDAAKRIDVVAHIVDDDEWEKVEQGVYTGFSPGGKYARRWRDGAHTRYTAQPTELSLVDLPAIPTATFSMIKAHGVAEDQPFRRLSGDELRKSLYSVSRLADLIASLSSLAESVAFEAAAEQDGSAMPGQLSGWLATGVSLLTDMAREEASEELAALAALVAKLPAPPADTLQQAAGIEDLAKRGARHSKDDFAHLQAAHDHLASLGVRCAGAPVTKAAGADDLAKMEGALSAARDDLAKAAGELARVEGDLETARNDLAKAAGERDTLRARVSTLEALPAPGGPRLKTMEKAVDTAPAARPAGNDTPKDEPQTFEEAMELAKAMAPGPEKTQALRQASRLAKIS